MFKYSSILAIIEKKTMFSILEFLGIYKKEKQIESKFSSIYSFQEGQKYKLPSKHLKIELANKNFNDTYEKYKCIVCHIECECFVSSKVQFNEQVIIFGTQRCEKLDALNKDEH